MGEDQLSNHIKNVREGLKPVSSTSSPGTSSSESPKKEAPPAPPRRVIPGLNTNPKTRSFSVNSAAKPLITEKPNSNQSGITEIHTTEDLKVEESRSRTNSTVSDDGESSGSGSRRGSFVGADDEVDDMSPSPSPLSSPMDTIRSLSDVLEPSKEVVYQTLRKKQIDESPRLERAYSQDKDLDLYVAHVHLPNAPVVEKQAEPEPEPEREPEPEPVAEPEPEPEVAQEPEPAQAEPEPTQPTEEPSPQQTEKPTPSYGKFVVFADFSQSCR